MSESKQTPPSWKLSPERWAGGWGRLGLPNRIRIIDDETREIIAYVEHHGAGDGQTKYPTEEDYSRARLLIQAPDVLRQRDELLEVCQFCLDIVDEAEREQDPLGDVTEDQVRLGIISAKLHGVIANTEAKL